MSLDILILGAGWTSTFLIPLCEAEGLMYAKTNRLGTDGAIPFNFPDDADFSKLPKARTVLVAFPLQRGWAERLANGIGTKTNWILLSSTVAWKAEGWNDRHSPFTPTERSLAEDELPGATILCLAGLYGADRQPKNWLGRVASTKEALAGKASHGPSYLRIR